MTLTMEVRAKAGKSTELYQTLQGLSPVIRKEQGCLKCRISRDVEDGEIYILSCDWEALADLELFMRSINGSALLGAIDLLGEKARIRIGTGTKWEDIEALKRMRK